MNSRIQASIAAPLLALALGGCSGMTHQERHPVAGATLGGVSASAMTGGSTAGMVTGAAASGVIGHEAGK